MCCSWQDKFHLKSTFINKNPLEFHILIIFIHPPLSHTNTHTLAKGWHDKTWLERISLPLLCKYMQITIFDCIFKLIKRQRFFFMFIAIEVYIVCFHLHRLVSLLTFVGIRSCQILNLVKVNAHNKYSESSVKILSKTMSKLR